MYSPSWLFIRTLSFMGMHLCSYSFGGIKWEPDILDGYPFGISFWEMNLPRAFLCILTQTQLWYSQHLPLNPTPPSTPLSSANSTISSPQTPTSLPPYQPIHPSIPKEQSPARVTYSGTSYLRDHSKLFPLREVTNRDAGTIWVHAQFSMSDLAQCRQRLGQFSKDSTKLMEESQALSLSFELTWRDIHITLSMCHIPQGKAAY